MIFNYKAYNDTCSMQNEKNGKFDFELIFCLKSILFEETGHRIDMTLQSSQ